MKNVLEWPIDSSLGLLRDGYQFIGKRCDDRRSNIFQTRLMLQETVCLRGQAAARLFYDDSRFRRAGAAPGMLKHTLIGEGGVQGMDGPAHLHRKSLFMDLLDEHGVEGILARTSAEYERAINRWESVRSIVLFHEMREIFCRAVCAWAGVPLPEGEVSRRTSEIGDLIEAPGSIGPKQWRGRLARKRAESWIVELVRQARDEPSGAGTDDALHAIALHRDERGELLDERVAAVEVLNILRPVVAVARFVVFLAMALVSYPDTRRSLESGEYEPEWVVQEVRRFYPFFPFVAARVRRPFTWEGHRFPAGARTILDLYGTNRDETSWAEPNRFDPTRFKDWDGDPFALVAQGGADAATNHRCPGEPLTIALMKQALDVLVDRVRYDVPAQDLTLDLTKMPALPPSGLVMANVRRPT